MANKILPTQDELRALFDYDPETGILRWKADGLHLRRGKVAGTLDKRGRIVVWVRPDFCAYAHRVIWAWMRGEWPQQVDHVDTVKYHNNWSNLRLATNSENQCNQSLHRGNTSGFKGVSLHRRTGKWVAEICKDGKKHHLGLFSSKEQASEAYKRAALELHGEFARF